MTDRRATIAPRLDVALTIKAPPSLVLRAFFDAGALGAWWRAARSVTVPRALGPYAVEWAATDFRDEVLGRLGGVFHGTVMQFEPGRGFLVAGAFWLPPDGDPIGPMALEIVCAHAESTDEATDLRVTQTGFEEGLRWRRYYEVVGAGWERALMSMKALLEK